MGYFWSLPLVAVPSVASQPFRGGAGGARGFVSAVGNFPFTCAFIDCFVSFQCSTCRQKKKKCEPDPKGRPKCKLCTSTKQPCLPFVEDTGTCFPLLVA